MPIFRRPPMPSPAQIARKPNAKMAKQLARGRVATAVARADAIRHQGDQLAADCERFPVIRNEKGEVVAVIRVPQRPAPVDRMTAALERISELEATIAELRGAKS